MEPLIEHKRNPDSLWCERYGGFRNQTACKANCYWITTCRDLKEWRKQNESKELPRKKVVKATKSKKGKPKKRRKSRTVKSRKGRKNKD